MEACVRGAQWTQASPRGGVSSVLALQSPGSQWPPVAGRRCLSQLVSVFGSCAAQNTVKCNETQGLYAEDFPVPDVS